MKKQLVSAVVLVAFSFASAVFNEKTTATDCLPDPCGTVCPNPCDDVCAKKSGCYLYDKSIFDSPLFENRLVGKKSKPGITFYGWMLTGITVNNHGATNTYEDGSVYGYNQRRNAGGDTVRTGMDDTSGNSYVLMLEQPTDWKVNQLWLGAKKDLCNKFGWGFQADFCYGTDVRYARNWSDGSLDYKWGSGDYYAAFANLNATVGTKDLFVKVGKFPGGFAYEGLAAPREYFYSHANIAYGRPLTVQGAMVEWHPNKKWMITGGWTAGVFNSFENPYGDNGFLGKATYNLNKDMALTYKIFYNDKGERPAGTVGGGDGGVASAVDCLNTLIFTWKLNKKWFYMGEIAYADHHSGGALTGFAWGTNHHLIRTFTDKFSVGFRGEYHYSRRSTFDNAGITGGEGGNLWDFTLAAHYKLTPKVTFRPELRYDYADYNNGYRPFGGDASKKDQFSGGVSLLMML